MMTSENLARHYRRLIGIACLVAGSMAPIRAAPPPVSPDDAYLNNLQGSWVMQGTLRGKPVRYAADGQRVLDGGFLRFHLIDAALPSKYEAEVYIGFDSEARDYIAHWLDRFGAPGARVVARGERNGEQLVLIFPYAEAAFRDTFTWIPQAGSWTLLLEAQDAHKAWSTFASYTLKRAAAH